MRDEGEFHLDLDDEDIKVLGDMALEGVMGQVVSDDAPDPGPWGPTLIIAMEDAEILPRYTQRVKIEAAEGEFTIIHAQIAVMHGQRLVEIMKVFGDKQVVTEEEVEASEDMIKRVAIEAGYKAVRRDDFDKMIDELGELRAFAQAHGAYDKTEETDDEEEA